MPKINQRLNGQNPLAYKGVNSYQPPDFITDNKPPTSNDSKGFQLGDVWLDISNSPNPPSIDDIYILVMILGDQATWVQMDSDYFNTLTGNSGGAVGIDALYNINVVGDATSVDAVGTPGTNTITLSASGTGVLQTLTGDSGGAVSPTTGNINLIGADTITVVGNPGTSTLTITPSGDIASSFITNPATSTATPVAGILTFTGDSVITCSASGSTVTIDGASSPNLTSLQSDDANVVTTTAGEINIAGGSNLATTGTSGPNTLTVNLDGITQYNVQVGGASNALTQIANGTTGQVFTATTGADPAWQTDGTTYSSGTFTPSLSFGGGSTGITYTTQNGYYTRINDIVFYNITIELSSKGSSTGNADITGFPFAAIATPPYWDSQAINVSDVGTITLDSGYNYFWINNSAFTTNAIMKQAGSGLVGIPVDNTNFSDTAAFNVQGFYVK